MPNRTSSMLLAVAFVAALYLPVERLVAQSAVAAAPSETVQQGYFPPRGEWERRSPEDVGMDPRLVQQAIDFAREHESTSPRDLEQNHYFTFGREPHGDAIGPFKTRGDMTGLIVRHGYIVAEWGEPTRVDMTFSITKSFLSSTVGLAWDRGLIADLHQLVRPYVPTDHFDSEHNAQITWDHLLRQTSNWEGTLWGKPDWADRPPRNAVLAEYRARVRNPPGSTYKYNDVRVNVLALAALHVWRRPLPQVLRELLMDPIGASNTWRWHGYENSWVNVDGVMVQSVSGGGHWGGGMWISGRDLARFGLLTLRRGKWEDRQILSDEWIVMALTPTPVQRTYGFMNFFLNTERRSLPSAPESAFHHRGSGTNVVYVDPEHDLVIVMRWIQRDAVDGVVQRVIAAILEGR